MSKAEEYLKKKFRNTYLDGNGTVINILPKDFYEVMEAYHQSRVNAKTDFKQLSLDILVLVNTDEFKNLEYVYQQHNMITELLKQ